jgi:hypothetical protein
VISHGGNIGVQVLQSAVCEADANGLVDEIEGIAGWLDGFDPRGIIALSVPATAGLPATEPGELQTSSSLLPLPR